MIKKITGKIQEPIDNKNKLIEQFDIIIDEISRIEDKFTKIFQEKLAYINLT
jgi:hypothetical protein